MNAVSSRFQRLLLPGLAFKSVVIGGGYATGRELAEFFLPSGPWGGIAGMALTMLVWSVVCAVTFLLARAIGARDYRAFFQHLLGRGWVLFEIAYLGLVIIVLAVFGAAAGELCRSMFGWPPLIGTVLLVGAIAAVVLAGNNAIERLFKYLSIFLYLVYAVAAVLMATRFGDRIIDQFDAAQGLGQGWALNGLTYAGYNIIGGIAILPLLRHMVSRRDAVVAGLLAGPLAILPAIVFFVCMVAYAPGIGDEPLPSDFLLGEVGLPWFHLVFRIMILAALIETGVAMVSSIDARACATWRERTGAMPAPRARLVLILGILLLAVFLADAIGLVALIASGYRLLAYALLATYVVPLLTVGVWWLWRHRDVADTPPPAPIPDARGAS